MNHRVDRGYSLKNSLGGIALLLIGMGMQGPATAQDIGGAAPAALAVAATPYQAIQVGHAETGMLLGIAKAGKRLIAVGGNGVIVSSEDGTHWKQKPSPVDVTLTGVAFADEKHGWAVGHDALILYTADGGESWKIQNFQPDLNAPIFSVVAVNATDAVAFGAFGTLKATHDGGATWTDVDAPELSSDKYHLNGASRLHNGSLLVVGEAGLAAISADGRHWKRLSVPYEGSLFGVLPWGDKGAVAYGMRGNVYVTQDAAGNQWKKMAIPVSSSFFGGFPLPGGGIGLVGGENRTVFIDPAEKASVITGGAQAGQATTLSGGIAYGAETLVIGERGVRRLNLQ